MKLNLSVLKTLKVLKEEGTFFEEEAIRITQGVGLKYVYIGNVPGHKYNSTFCPKCDKRLIHRIHFSVLSNNIKDGKCKFCQYEIHGIWR